MDGALVVDEPTFQVGGHVDQCLGISEQSVTIVDHVSGELDHTGCAARTDLIEKLNRLKDETIALF